VPGYDYGETPWYSHRESITAVIIIDGVAGIGTFAFAGLNHLASAAIPASVSAIGMYAFWNCVNLAAVTVVWETPLPVHANMNIFGNVPLASATLHVPAEHGSYTSLPAYGKISAQ
jgi:hypothetical protein